MRCPLTILVLLAVAAPCLAQDPFSSLEMRIQATQNVNQNILHDHWHPGRGMKASLVTPFYFGDWGISLGVHRFDARSDVPGFGALWISSDWGVRLPFGYRFALTPAVGIGNYRMSFDDAVTTFSGESSESDFVSSASLRASLRIGRDWFLFGQAERLLVQTRPLMELWFASAGVGYQMEAGRLLKAILE